MFLSIGIVMILLVGSFKLSGLRVGINLTRSQPDWVYIISPVKVIRRGEKVAFLFQGSRYYPAGTLFVKEVVGLPGDRIENSSEAVWINGEKVGAVRATDSEGRAVAPFVYRGRIPKGAYFVMAHAPNSYDSRYFGWVEEKQIIGEVIPLF